MAERQFKDTNKQSVQRTTHTKAPQPNTSPLLKLQSLVGNQGVQRLLEGKSGQPSKFIQTKLTVGAADDSYEHEADRVADAVMKMPDAVQREDTPEDEPDVMTMRDTIQREDTPEDEPDVMTMRDLVQREDTPEDEPDVMTKSENDLSGSFEVGGDIESQINSSQGSGNELSSSAREFFEPRFGQDFGEVRVHTGSEADTLNRSLQARAFTTGSDIYFREGEYQPDNDSGRSLLAHELTHVIQQTGGKPQSQE